MRSARLLCLTALPMLTGCITTFEAGAPAGVPDVIAHRGASAYAPENTMAAFRAALEMKADWFELDCHLTKDGKVIVIHDGSVDKTTNGAGNVADMSLEELKALDAGTWFDKKFEGEPLPTLAESLDFARGKIGVYVEIKGAGGDDELIDGLRAMVRGHTVLSPLLREEMMALVKKSGTRNLELTRKSVAAVQRRGMGRQVVIQSFSPVVCFVAIEEAPELRVEFLGSDDEENPDHWGEFVDFGNLINVAGFNVHHESISRSRLKSFHADGKSVAVWTVDGSGDMRRYADMGVDGIITNKPDLCLRAVGRGGKR